MNYCYEVAWLSYFTIQSKKRLNQVSLAASVPPYYTKAFLRVQYVEALYWRPWSRYVYRQPQSGVIFPMSSAGG